MPTSHLNLIEEVIGPMVYLDPKSILDIGPGFGKFGFLAREFLEVWEGDINRLKKWARRIDAIEVFPEYLTPVHSYIYDKVHIGDAAAILPTITDHYDLVIFIGVLEHFEYERGVAVVRECLRVGRNVLIAVPQNLGDQGEMFGNPYERHLADWRKKNFEQFGPFCVVPQEDCLVVCLGPDAERLRLTLRYVATRTFIRRHALWLRFIYRRMKKNPQILPNARM
jgi:SAM-dependent methyltransferase